MVAGVFAAGGMAACSEGMAPTTPSTVTADKTFLLMEPPPGHNRTASGVVSHDGKVVTGFSGLEPVNDMAVYRWTATGGPHGQLQWLEPPGVNKAPDALLNIFSIGLSADSKVLMGTMLRQDGNALFRWDDEEGMTDLGAIPGRGLVFTHVDMSDDGAVVMATDGQQAFRWTRTDGRVSLGQLPGDVGAEAIAMSADGQVIVGNSVVLPDRAYRVFRWTPSRGMVAIDLVPGSPSCETKGHMSDDGSVLFGLCKPAVAGQAQTLFRWTEATGTETIAVTDLPYAQVMPWSLSGDGTVLVGSFGRGSPPLPSEAGNLQTAVFRWTLQAGLTRLVPPEGFLNCLAVEAVSSDGDVVIAGCNGPGAAGAVKWDAAGTAAALEVPPGFKSVMASSVTSDSHLIAGFAQAPGGTDEPPLETAVLWDDRKAAPMLVTDFLIDQGIPTDGLAGAQLQSARVSRDGRTFIGDAIDSSARNVSWLAYLP